MSNPMIRRAALVLMSLPKEAASDLMAKFKPNEVELISAAIAKIGVPGSDEQEAAIDDFAEARSCATNNSPSFAFLREVESRSLRALIIDEHPQTIALIVAHLSPTQAADVMCAMPGDRQVAVLRRIATQGQANPVIIDDVERALERRMSGIMGQPSNDAGGAGKVAQILKATDRATAKMLLAALGKEAPDLADEIQRLLDHAHACQTAA